MNKYRIYLSPPHLSGKELTHVEKAIADNWVAPAGPFLDEFERRMCALAGVKHAVAVSSGTAALHLALHALGIGPGDEVVCSTFTFVAAANPIIYLGGKPVFVDSDRVSWNMDPSLLADFLKRRARNNNLPKALITVHVYGQCADLDAISDLCRKYEIILVEDAAEALGATYKDSRPGAYGKVAAFSFNGNKIITTSGGGMLVSDDSGIIRQARHLATQAREQGPVYLHRQVGYNYRMSNILAGIGLGQLDVLEDRIQARRRIFDNYTRALGGLPGVEFMPETPYGRSTRWLTCMVINPRQSPADNLAIHEKLAEEGIESRPTWMPLHLQPIFKNCECIGGEVARELGQNGLCLPSSSLMTEADQQTVIQAVREIFKR